MTQRTSFYYYTEWVLSHHRYGLLMLGLILLSFINNQAVAAVLSLLFGVELVMRGTLMHYKRQTNPYKSSLNLKLDVLFMFFDFLALLSLMMTAFDVAGMLGEEGAAARVIRAFYLLRVLRIFRYVDMQSLMFSPGYGMFISLIVMLSFFVEGQFLWAIIVYFIVEIMIRLLLLRNMNFPTARDKRVEWLFWWIDVVATIVMMPGLTSMPFGNALRALRLIRLLRPWIVIMRNLVTVFREGDYSQEIVLVILLIAMLSITGGVVGHYTMPGFDFNQDAALSGNDKNLTVQIWFAFRTLMAAGNLVHDPLGNDNLALFSVLSVVLGMFILAFFIGIGSSIISGLMAKLRNEKLMMANHMVMIGWNKTSPFIVEKLRLISDLRFSRMKLVFLNEHEQRPEGLENWVTFRWGDPEDTESMHRVNLGSALQAIICPDDALKASEELSQNLFSLMAIRQANPDIPVTYTVMGMVQPRLRSYRHMLQVGWDKQGFYDKPTVMMSEPEMRANLLRNVLVYPDFDQVMGRLMIPEREDESAMQVVEWNGAIVSYEGAWHFQDGERRVPVDLMMRRCFAAGVVLVAVADETLHVQPLTAIDAELKVTTLLGIAVDNHTLYGEFVHEFGRDAADDASTGDCLPAQLQEICGDKLNLLAIGWVGALPLILKRLLDSYESVDITMLDDMTPAQQADTQAYVQRRVAEMPGAEDRIKVSIRSWDFLHMEALREHIARADSVVVSRPAHIHRKPHAMVASVLSHAFSLAAEEDVSPHLFAVVDTRSQAHMLQKEMDRFSAGMDVNVVVPTEFYGTYVAHTSYHMFDSASPAVYDMHRSLRYLLDSLMSDRAAESVPLSLDVLSWQECRTDIPGCGSCAVDAGILFERLLARGMVWIGFRVHASVVPAIRPNIVMRAFPRRHDFQCSRQHSIMINPLGNPLSREIWKQQHSSVAELIVIRAR